MSIEPFSKGLGLVGQSPPDYRDHMYGAPREHLLTPPEYMDLRANRATPRIFDQGNLGSCTANAANAIVQFVERKDSDPDYDRLSRLYTYYYSRVKIGTPLEDSGALIRDTFDVLAERGTPREKFWPYNIQKFADEPPALDYRAGQHRAIEYLSVEDGNEQAMVACLAEGYPFTYGFAVYRSFWNVGADGRWDGTPGVIDGYHAVDAWGYDFRAGAFGFDEGGWIIRNSWSTDFGDQGYFYVPRVYMSVDAFDCWTIRKVVR